MNNDNNINDKVKLWAGIILILLILTPLIIKVVKSDKPIKNNTTLGLAHEYRH